MIMFKLIMLIFGSVTLKAWRDKITFDWRIPGNEDKDKKLWHIAGFISLLWLALWSLWMVVPISWHFGALTMLIGAITWWLFDIVLNLFRGLPWDHIGDSETEKKLSKDIFAWKLAILSLALILTLITM